LYFFIPEIIYSVQTYDVYVNVIFNACLCLHVDIPPYSWGYTPETTGVGHITEVIYIHNV